jgi:dihydrofolate reductase
MSAPRSARRLAVIAAHAENMTIGRGGGLPWSIKPDFDRFLHLVTVADNIDCVMGRHVFDELTAMKKMPLTGGENVVISSSMAQPPGRELPDRVTVLPSVEAFLSRPAGPNLSYVLGGSRIYSSLMPHASLLRLTHIHAPYDGDTFFPAYDLKEWAEVFRRDEVRVRDRKSGAEVDLTFIDYIRPGSEIKLAQDMSSANQPSTRSQD